MTQGKSLKRRVRERMSKTGERYTAARRHVVSESAADRSAPTSSPAAEQEPLHGPTSRTWSDWVRLLDDWGAAHKPHRDIARWLSSEHGVPDWWTQDITVRYERHIGRRVVGQRGSTFSATGTKTIAAAPDVVRAAWLDETVRARWLPEVRLRRRPNRAPIASRFDVNDGEGRLIVSFDPRGDSRTVVALEHEKLPDQRGAARWTAFWRQRLVVLKELLES